MIRTVLLLATTALLAIGAAVVGPPRPNCDFILDDPAPPAPVKPLPLTDFSANADALRLEGHLSGDYLLAGAGETYASLTVSASRPSVTRRLPVNLALAIDRSGSMRGQKLEDAKHAARLLVRTLGPQDRLALVHYGTDVRVLPSELVTLEARERMLAFVDGIEDEGATNISGGLEAAAAQVRRYELGFSVSRIILLSDGQPTEGLTEPGQLRELAMNYREGRLTLSALGVGEDFDERLMRGLAEQGGGFYGYIEDSQRLAEVLQRELDQATGAVARRVQLRLTLPEGVQSAEVLGVPTRDESGMLVVPLYDLAGGQTARVMVRLTTHMTGAPWERKVLDARLTYDDVRTGQRVDRDVHLGAKLTYEVGQVQAHLNQGVDRDAARALGARRMQEAVEEMKQGRREQALGLLDDVRRLFARSASADALAGDVAEVERTEAALRGASDETSVKHEALKLHRKSLQSFGQNNAY